MIPAPKLVVDTLVGTLTALFLLVVVVVVVVVDVGPVVVTVVVDTGPVVVSELFCAAAFSGTGNRVMTSI